MSNQYNFLNSSVKNAEAAFDAAVNNKNTRSLTFQKERQEILNQIKTAYEYQEIDKREFMELSDCLAKVDFSKVPEARAKIKEAQKVQENLKYRGGGIKEVNYKLA